MDRASRKTLQDKEPHGPLDSTMEQRLGGPVRGEDTGLGARRCLGPALSPQEWWGLRKPPLGTPDSPFWTVWIRQDCRLLQLLSAKTPRSPPCVLQGAGQEGRKSHAFSEATLSEGEGTDS